MLTKKLVTAAAAALAFSLTLSACSGSTTESSDGSNSAVGANLEEITAKAKEEGRVQLIAVPDDWANYKGHFAEFEEKYGVKIDVASPDASSAEELQSVKTLKGQATQPDVLDIGYSFTTPAIDQGLIEAYKPSNFEKIPTELKDPDGMWVGAYYGVISMGVNTDMVDAPKTFKDLLDPKYKGKIALPGDPRKGASSIATVMAASLANGGSLDDIEPGIDYFQKLADSGNLVNITSPAAALSTGEAAVVFDWNYNLIGAKDQIEQSGINFEMIVPSDGVYGNYYAQPVTVNSPQPNAGRLWVDWLTSDEGSEQYALGGAVPARYQELKDAGKLSDKALSMLPDADILDKISFPTIDQGAQANEKIAESWAQKVQIK